MQLTYRAMGVLELLAALATLGLAWQLWTADASGVWMSRYLGLLLVAFCLGLGGLASLQRFEGSRVEGYQVKFMTHALGMLSGGVILALGFTASAGGTKLPLYRLEFLILGLLAAFIALGNYGLELWDRRRRQAATEPPGRR